MTTPHAPAVSGTRAPRQCRACGVAVRGSKQWLCPACSALRESLFRQAHSPLDDDWIAARNRWFGSMAGVEAVRDALDAEAARAGAAA
jgi:hypothetical protein